MIGQVYTYVDNPPYYTSGSIGIGVANYYVPGVNPISIVSIASATIDNLMVAFDRMCPALQHFLSHLPI
jgi:hypothetical protein